MTPVEKSVETVLGPLPIAALGRTLVHEHIFIATAGSLLDPSVPLDRAVVIDRGVAALEDLKRHGVGTIVDPCPIELGRDPEILAAVSRQSGVNIVCATGFYVEHDGLGIPFYWRQRHPEEIAELYLHELRTGIGTTGVRAGVIKAASGAPIGTFEGRTLQAAGLAGAAASVTVITHTENSLGSLAQQTSLLQSGADPTRVLIGHQDSQTIDIATQIAERGSFVGVDRVGYESFATDDDRADLVAGLFANGYGDHVCVSQDRMATYWEPRPNFWVEPKDMAHTREVILPHNRVEETGRGFSWVFDDFVPRLTARGLTADDLETIFVRNPARLLSQ